jgi:A/G-specific adenine glycosylase
VEERLLASYARHGRDLAWRRTRDPYAILVSEVMLQQTQMGRSSRVNLDWLSALADRRDGWPQPGRYSLGHTGILR